MANYWESEKPQEVDTGKNILRYFAQAGKLQISMPNWTDNAGAEKRGKTLTVDIAALQETPEALEILRQIAGEHN